MQAFFSRHGRAAMETKLRAARIAYRAVNDLADLSGLPHLRRQRVLSETGEIDLPAPQCSGRLADGARLPRIGEHSAGSAANSQHPSSKERPYHRDASSPK